MKHIFPVTALGIVSILGLSNPSLANHPSVSSKFGTPIHEGLADRVIVVDSSTKWINVTDGETVKFVLRTSRGEQTFLWKFDTLMQPTFDLAKITPGNTMSDRTAVPIYVAPGPAQTD